MSDEKSCHAAAVSRAVSKISGIVVLPSLPRKHCLGGAPRVLGRAGEEHCRLNNIKFRDAFQAHRLVSALFSQDVHPGELFIEAKIKSLLAPARSPQEGFYESIIQDVRDRDYVNFLGMSTQARILISARIAAGADWGQLYKDAQRGKFWAPAGSTREEFFAAVLQELRDRVGSGPVEQAFSPPFNASVGNTADKQLAQEKALKMKAIISTWLTEGTFRTYRTDPDHVGLLGSPRLAAGADWGQMYAEARRGQFWAPARSVHKAFYFAILDELKDRC
ncbi:hypothetical protein QBC42DRAFT_247864 [Cladorrhinum samala]|uniref:Uncharacterized protein n=1 Tax=Cladorrhinum samala TaxID=585594 RepID=A0AAV9HZD2_9PEZI|nr:hypothetical protein QBC42DRAFT_247864 [Cladorrhinum samala]